jgi:hypothetical protein
MILLTHILIAVLSIILNTFILFSPSKSKLKISYFLTVFTIATGTYLILNLHTHLAQACLSGLVYLGYTLATSAYAYSRLALENK